MIILQLNNKTEILYAQKNGKDNYKKMVLVKKLLVIPN